MERRRELARMRRLRRGGEWLRNERKSRGWATGTSFAKALGVGQERLSAYERGQYEVDPDVARQIARVLGLPELAVWRGLELPLPAEPETGPDDEREIREIKKRVLTGLDISEEELDVAARAIRVFQAKRRNLPPPPSRGHSRVVSEGGGHERDGDGDLA